MGATRHMPAAAVADTLFGATRQAVLRLLFGHPDERFYQRQIVRELALGSGAVQRELERLTASGILTRVVEGRHAFYQANSECPVFEELRGLIRKTFGVVDVLRDALSPLADEIRIAFVFGSIARSAERAGSDVDLIVVGDRPRPADVYAAIQPAQDILRREINPKVYHTAEFRRKLSTGQHFLRSVLAGPRAFIVGDERELAELAD